MSIGYIQKQTYIRGRDPKFKFHNAIALDKASFGLLAFRDHTEGDIDWGYVYEQLKKAKRKGDI